MAKQLRVTYRREATFDLGRMLRIFKGAGVLRTTRPSTVNRRYLSKSYGKKDIEKYLDGDGKIGFVLPPTDELHPDGEAKFRPYLLINFIANCLGTDSIHAIQGDNENLVLDARIETAAIEK